jgi:hypothetical protein
VASLAGAWDRSSSSGKHSGSALTQRIASGGLADSFMAFNTNYHDSGLFGVYAVTDAERCENLSWVVMNELTKLCYEVRDADVVRARNQLKSSLLFFQDSTHRAPPLGWIMCLSLSPVVLGPCHGVALLQAARSTRTWPPGSDSLQMAGRDHASWVLCGRWIQIARLPPDGRTLHS